MNRTLGLSLFFGLLVGGIVTTHALTTDRLPDGLACQSERLAAYGWTDKRQSMAELAAIRAWQKEAAERDPEAGHWHLARKRSMSCRAFENSAHFQCVVSAKPCKMTGG